MTICTACGQQNREGARFCDACAGPLPIAAEPTREVRKTVTVVFCDVVGSTELGDRLDPEVLRGVMARFYAAAREPVERHGGRVEKVIGDALVAVFGIPLVHEDDALRGVRAALEMRDAVRAMGEIQARIGVNTGDVLARDATVGESLVVGDAVNLAARLQQAAPPGTVLVGEATWSLVAHAVRGEPVAPVAAKGKRDPLVAWRLEGVDPGAPAHRRRFDLPIVARQTELELLRLVAERTEQLGRAHLVTVLGQPGIGKSRLVAELRLIRPGLTVLTGHCRATAASSSLEPLLEAALGALGGGPSPAKAIGDLMPGDPEGAAVAACLAPTGAAGASDVAWAASRLIGTMATAGSVAIVLEDVHWAEDALLDVVEQLVGRTRRRSLLVVCTARPEFTDRRTTWGSGTNTVSLALERLDDAQTRQLLTNADPSLPTERAERVIATAEGNPLFAEHLAALVEEYDPAGSLPRSIQVLLSARLEALPDPEREVVSVAAVVGRDFSVAAVEALVARPIVLDIDRLTQRELIAPTAAGRQQFGHALLQEAAYGLIPKQRRSELHTRLARWLDDEGVGDAAVGDHLEHASRLRTELGLADEITAQISSEAGTRLAAAGRRADSMGDPAGARQLLERALNLLPERSPRRAEAMVELAAAGWNLLPRDEIERLLTAGADLAADLGLRALELRARLVRLGVDVDAFAVPDREVVDVGAALRELEELDDPRALAAALCTQASQECADGRAATALALAERALEVVRAADEDTVWPLSLLVWAIFESPIPVPEAEVLLGRLIDELGMRPTVRAELMLGQAMLALLAGRSEQAWRLLDNAREIEQDLGLIDSWRLVDAHVLMLLRASRFEEARGVLRPMVAEHERRGDVWEVALARSRLGLAEVRLGNLGEAREQAGAARDLAHSAGGYEAQTRAHIVLSEAHLAEGDVAAALELAREGLAIAAVGDWVLLTADARLAIARALHRARSLEEAATEASTALRLYQGKGYAAGVADVDAFVRSLGR
jgi:class 3 adenylate cyclase/tetratricopeptide (TPR) repeat protein